jgi:HK97 gp10 family phage protein
MATKINVQFEGFAEFKELANKILDDFGEKDANNIMVAAARRSMSSALNTARSKAPSDTGALRASLQIEARKPRNKDRKSKYVQNGDVAIALITTASGKKLASGVKVYDIEASYAKKKDVYKKVSVKSDARAVVMEFGSAKTPAQPYLRSALESSSVSVVNDLSQSLKTALEKYKARQAKRKTA